MSSVLKLCACSSLFFTTDDHYKDSANVRAARPGKTVGAEGKSVECNGCDSESKSECVKIKRRMKEACFVCTDLQRHMMLWEIKMIHQALRFAR